MRPERWRQVEKIYEAVVASPADERAAALTDLCAGDRELRQEVESLLACDDKASGFLATPAVAAVSDVLDEQRLVGRKFGAYVVRSFLDAGGMGEVYRARDARLGRDVAIKILPRLSSDDPDRLARFEQEARLLAALNHPHIGAIYGLEHLEERPALVLELVEGETLAERIARGALPVSEALRIARQIAEALEAAHERGIIHRDLKPANIKITAEGVVKVLDFGLAKLSAPDGRGSEQALPHSPTAVPGTREGVILGTAAYMSPEQARGMPVDRRTDIWAFGCVLFEMLTGRQPFAGDTTTDMLAAILEREPTWTVLPPVVPAVVRRMLQRCLEKDPKRRLRDIGDARLDIDDGDGAAPPAVAVVQTRSRRRERLVWASGLAAVMAIAVVAGLAPWRSAPPAPEMRFDVTTPPTTDLSMAISPDGKSLVFVATSERGPRLWVRSLVSGSSRELLGTDGARMPFWSPDSRTVAFFANDKLKRIDIEGGAAQVVVNANNAGSGTWSRDGTILFGMGTGGPIFRVSASGGEPVAVTPPGQRGLKEFPEVLPDGRHFLYQVRQVADPGAYVSAMEGGEPRRLFAADSPAVYVSSGQLLFFRQDTLFAQDFDPVGLELTGNPYPVVSGVPRGIVSASVAGPIAYRSGWGPGNASRNLVWFDRSGTEIQNVNDPVHTGWANPELSPDGRHVAIWRTENGNPDIWLFDLRRSVFGRFTSDPSMDNNPIWSPDSTRIAFTSGRTGQIDLFQKAVTGTGAEELLLTTPHVKSPTDWSPDGRFLLYESADPETLQNIWALPMYGNRTPFPVAHTAFKELNAKFSPDGKWIAYQSNDSGPDEIYVQPFPGPEGKTQVSSGGGAQPRWRQDGKELFYLALDGRLMAAPVQLPSNDQSIEIGKAVPLFLTRVFAVQGTNIRQQYMVSPDGQRFLVDSVTGSVDSPITVILNWKPRP